MPRTRSLAWSELRTGVLTVLALIIIAVTIFTLTGSRGFFWQRYTLEDEVRQRRRPEERIARSAWPASRSEW